MIEDLCNSGTFVVHEANDESIQKMKGNWKMNTTYQLLMITLATLSMPQMNIRSLKIKREDNQNFHRRTGVYSFSGPPGSLRFELKHR